MSEKSFIGIDCKRSDICLQEGDYVFSYNCLFVCLSVTNITQSHERIVKFYEGVWGGKRNVIKTWWQSGSHADCPIKNHNVAVT